MNFSQYLLLYNWNIIHLNNNLDYNLTIFFFKRFYFKFWPVKKYYKHNFSQNADSKENITNTNMYIIKSYLINTVLHGYPEKNKE